VRSGEGEQLNIRTNGPCKAQLCDPDQSIIEAKWNFFGVTVVLNNEHLHLFSGAMGEAVVRHVVSAALVGVRTEL